jgi:hypothetical protein
VLFVHKHSFFYCNSFTALLDFHLCVLPPPVNFFHAHSGDVDTGIVSFSDCPVLGHELNTGLNTVTMQIPGRPDFEWSFFGHNFCPVFKWSAAILFKLFKNRTSSLVYLWS